MPDAAPGQPPIDYARPGALRPDGAHPRERLWQLQQKFAPYLFLSPFVILFSASCSTRSAAASC